MFHSRPTGEKLAVRTPFAGRPARHRISAGHDMRFGRVRRMPRVAADPRVRDGGGVTGFRKPGDPAGPPLPAGARQFLPGIRRNSRPELMFGNEADFCCGFGKVMS